MNLRLRLLLGALTDAQAYKRLFRVLWAMVIVGLILLVGLCAGSAYALWLYWPTLLLLGTFGGGSFSLWGLLWPILAWLRLPLDFARLGGLYSTEPFALALAVRRALEGGDAILAPVAAAPTEDAEPSVFASAPRPSAASLVVALPDALVIALTGPISLTVLAVLLLLMAAGGAALATVIFSMSFIQLLGSQTGQLYLVGVCGSLTFLGLLLLLLARRQIRLRRMQRRGMEVTLDDLGLSFHQPVWAKRPRHIAWAEMRGLGRYTYKDKQTRELNLYILTSDEQTLIWAEPPTERYALPADRQRVATLQQSSWDLVTIITQRTRLPIRDLSAALAIVADTASSTSSSRSTSSFLKEAYTVALAEMDVETATALWRLRQPRARRQPRALRKLAAAAPVPGVSLTPLEAPGAPAIPAPVTRRRQASVYLTSLLKKPEDLLRVARALIPWYPTEDAPTTPARFRRFLRRDRVRRSLVRQLAWTMLCIFLAIFVVAGLYQRQEQGMTSLLNAVPQQTTAQKPLYFASFVSPQSDWTVQKSSKDDPTAAAFVHSAYQVSCDDPNSSAIFWTSRDQEGDVALSTTVTIHGPATQDNYSTGGLLFDVTGGGYAFSTFGVDEQGDWYLERYDSFRDFNNPWSTVDFNSSQAVRTGDNATNRLLVVRHGQFYLLYVNDVLVDRYYDTDHSLPPGGDVGVYIDACNITANFNDFAVYSVPPRLAAVRVASNLPVWLTY